MKILLVIGLPAIVLGFSYYAMLRVGLREEANRIAERLLWCVGIAIVVAVIILATGVKGSAQLSEALKSFLNWLNS